jgi:hypothetical protein
MKRFYQQALRFSTAAINHVEEIWVTAKQPIPWSKFQITACESPEQRGCYPQRMRLEIPAGIDLKSLKELLNVHPDILDIDGEPTQSSKVVPAWQKPKCT